MKKDNEKRRILNIMQDEDLVIFSSAAISAMRIKDYKKMSLEQQSVCRNIYYRLDMANQIQKEKGFGEVWGIEVALWELKILYQKLTSIPEHNIVIPAMYYQMVFDRMTSVERMEHSEIIPYRSCETCDDIMCDKRRNNESFFCDNWYNKEEIGKSYALKLAKNPNRKNK